MLDEKNARYLQFAKNLITRTNSSQELSEAELAELEDFVIEVSRFQIHLGMERTLAMCCALSARISKIEAFLNRPLN